MFPKALLLRIALCVGPLGGPGIISAQVSPIQLEVNGGLTVPRHDATLAAGREAGSAESFGVHFALTRGRTSWYVGFSENRTECREGSCSGDYVSTSWDLGLRFNILEGPVVPWIRAGVISQITTAQLVDPAADPRPGGPIPLYAAQSGRSWALEGGMGVTIRLAERVGISPGIRYTSLDPSFSGASVGDVDLGIWVVDVGLILGLF